MAIVVPSMSLKGWIQSVQEKADYLLAYFFISDPAQTYLYLGYISNLQALLQQKGNSIPALCQALQNVLETYYSRHFDIALASVTSDDVTSGNITNVITLTVVITVTQNGQQYSVGRLVDVDNGKFTKVRSYIDNGPSN